MTTLEIPAGLAGYATTSVSSVTEEFSKKTRQIDDAYTDIDELTNQITDTATRVKENCEDLWQRVTADIENINSDYQACLNYKGELWDEVFTYVRQGGDSRYLNTDNAEYFGELFRSLTPDRKAKYVADRVIENVGFDAEISRLEGYGQAARTLIAKIEALISSSENVIDKASEAAAKVMRLVELNAFYAGSFFRMAAYQKVLGEYLFGMHQTDLAGKLSVESIRTVVYDTFVGPSGGLVELARQAREENPYNFENTDTAIGGQNPEVYEGYNTTTASAPPYVPMSQGPVSTYADQYAPGIEEALYQEFLAYRQEHGARANLNDFTNLLGEKYNTAELPPAIQEEVRKFMIEHKGDEFYHDGKMGPWTPDMYFNMWAMHMFDQLPAA